MCVCVKQSINQRPITTPVYERFKSNVYNKNKLVIIHVSIKIGSLENYKLNIYIYNIIVLLYYYNFSPSIIIPSRIKIVSDFIYSQIIVSMRQCFYFSKIIY